MTVVRLIFFYTAPGTTDTYTRALHDALPICSGTYNRPPLASEGCVVLPNDDLLEVGRYVALGQTPILIGNGIQWLPADEWKQKKNEVNAMFEQWISDWESRNTVNYLSHYSKDFLTGKKDYAYWATHKQRIAKYKKSIQVEASDVKNGRA